MLDKILKSPTSMAAKRLAQKLVAAVDDHALQVRRQQIKDSDLAPKRSKAILQSPAHDAMAKGTHQQVVAAATSPSRPGTKTSAGHVQAAMRAPSPGLQLRSVRVAAPDSASGPKSQGFAWRAPKTSK